MQHLRDLPANVASKGLTGKLTRLDATLTKNTGRGCRLWLTSIDLGLLTFLGSAPIIYPALRGGPLPHPLSLTVPPSRCSAPPPRFLPRPSRPKGEWLSLRRAVWALPGGVCFAAP